MVADAALLVAPHSQHCLNCCDANPSAAQGDKQPRHQAASAAASLPIAVTVGGWWRGRVGLGGGRSVVVNTAVSDLQVELMHQNIRVGCESDGWRSRQDEDYSSPLAVVWDLATNISTR
jgi:hypothetical protein